MRKKASLAVLALALLLVLALLFHREPREEKPRPAPKAISVVSPAEPSTPTALPVRLTPVAAAASPTPPPVVVQGPPGTLRGNVKIRGEIPTRKRARLESDPKCDQMHAAVVMYENLVVDAAGNVQWAFVRIRSGPVGAPPPAPTTPVLLDQMRCLFTPHMVGVRVGQPVRVTSSDDLLHNVHGLPFENKEFNVGLPQAGMDVVRTFDKPEVFVIKCDIHPWMRAVVGVVDHNFWSITNELGTYVIRDVPPGKFTIEVWHEMYKPVTREVQFPPGGDVALDFVLDEKRD